MLSADSQLSSQFSSDGLGLLWSDNLICQPRLGLAFYVQFCSKPQCYCREVRLQCAIVDARLIRLSRNEQGLQGIYPDPLDPQEPIHTETGYVTLHLDTGAVLAEHSSPDMRFQTWIQEKQTGEMLEWLHGLWTQHKLFPLAPVEPESIEGPMVAFDDVFQGGRADMYQIDSQIYALIDCHCVIPSCDCKRAEIMVLSLEEEDIVSSITLDNTSDVTRAVYSDDLAEQIWTLYLKRFQNNLRLTQRGEDIRQVYQARAAAG